LAEFREQWKEISREHGVSQPFPEEAMKLWLDIRQTLHLDTSCQRARRVMDELGKHFATSRQAVRKDLIEQLPVGPLITDESQITDEYIEDFFQRMQEQGFSFTPTPEDIEDTERMLKRVREELARRSSSPEEPSPK
jgi:hypothetical protein